MIMDGMLSNISQRLHEVNTLLATYGQGVLSFEQVFSSSLLSETNKFLSLDRTPLQVADFETLFREHLKPLELRYEEAKASATKLWSEYSAMSSRLDFLPLGSS